MHSTALRMTVCPPQQCNVNSCRPPTCSPGPPAPVWALTAVSNLQCLVCVYILMGGAGCLHDHDVIPCSSVVAPRIRHRAIAATTESTAREERSREDVPLVVSRLLSFFLGILYWILVVVIFVCTISSFIAPARKVTWPYATPEKFILLQHV